MLLQALLFIILLVGIDQGTKFWALHSLRSLDTIPLLSGIFHFTFVENRGAAFGILKNQTLFFIIITLCILGGIAYYYIKFPKEQPYPLVRFSLLLISAGAIGNLIDRIRQSYVIDFFDFRLINFPVFNMADIYVVIGTILLSYILIFIIKEPTEKGNA